MKLSELAAKILADNLRSLVERLEKRVDDAVAAKPIPPFVLPQQWHHGARYGCHQLVRHRNGMFLALADTTGEPGVTKDGSWLPILVGVAEIRTSIAGRTLSVVIEQSDGKVAQMAEDLPIPIVRGVWTAETKFAPNDMVTRDFSLWIATKESTGVKPGKTDGAEYWRQVVRAGPKSATFALDEKTCILSMQIGDEAAVNLGSIKPALYETLQAAGILSAAQVAALEGRA